MFSSNVGFNGNPFLKPAGTPIQYTQEQVAEYIKCANDPIYFITHYVYIINLDKGKMLFSLWDFQEDMVNTFLNNRFVICKIPRQSGKSQTAIAFFLHQILFNQNYSIAILANKGDLAKDLLARLKFAYENLPPWLQQGVITWNKFSIELENGSKVVASATSSSGIRGQSYSCITEDSSITIKFNNDIFDISIGELYEALANSSKNTSNINKTEIFLEDIDGEVFRQQIYKMVLHDSEQQDSKSSNRHTKIYGRKASYSSKMLGRNGCRRKYNSGSFKGTYFTAQTFDQNDRSQELLSEIVVCANENDIGTTRTTNGIGVGGTKLFDSKTIRESKRKNYGKKAYRRIEETNEFGSKGKGLFRGNQEKNFRIQKGAGTWCEKTRWLWREDIESIKGQKEISGTCSKDKQESGENKKDGRKTQRNEKITRSKTKNEFGGNGTNSLEQRIEVSTEKGFREFKGIRITKKQPTIIVKLECGKHIQCTKDHKIYTNLGWQEAKECYDLHVKTTNGYSRVIEIQESQKENVYDLLEVEETNSFYANGVLVHNCVFLDEFAHVQFNLQEEFFKSTYPTISSGKTTKLFIVSTPKGLNLFYKIWTGAIEKKNHYVPIDVHWSRIPGRDEKWKEETIANTSVEQFNQEFNTEFLGSSNTLIHSAKLQCLAAKSPIYSKEGFDLWNKPLEKHIYTVVVDVSHGLNQDYSVAQVIDITEAPYRIVAKYRSNEVTPILLPNIIYKIAKDFNNADVLIEVNDIGQQVADILHYELEYDNILTTVVKGRKGQMVSGGFSKNIQWGVKTTAPVKRIGCINLKDLIESDKLIVEDMDTIMEFSTFVEKGNSYEAEPGAHDDLVMPLVLFGWLTTQRMFKEMTDMDIRTKMHENLLKNIEDDMLPFGFINDGLDETEVVDNEGCIWTVV